VPLLADRIDGAEILLDDATRSQEEEIISRGGNTESSRNSTEPSLDSAPDPSFQRSVPLRRRSRR
jgi:hypothetical protein